MNDDERITQKDIPVENFSELFPKSFYYLAPYTIILFTFVLFAFYRLL